MRIAGANTWRYGHDPSAPPSVTYSLETMSTPQFPKLDPAGAAFWDVRYQEQFTPWDAGRVPALLVEHMAKSASPRAALVPGCGSAHEAAFMAQQGWNVLAIDFSPAAVAAARVVLGVHADRVREADFFGGGLEPGAFDFVYERAFLCALPRRLWADWGSRMAELICPGGLLAGFFFFDDGERGPPFGLHGGELEPLLTPHFKLEEEALPADSIAVFQGKEKWMAWRRL